MTNEQEFALNDAIEGIYRICFGLEIDDFIEQYFDEKLLVIGTTVDERYFTLEGVRELIRHQKEQTVGLEVHFEMKDTYQDIRANGSVALNVKDILATLKVGQEIVTFEVRSTVILELKDGSWKLFHWHASKPEYVASESDTFGIEDWKKKTTALEKLVDERTADLRQKNNELQSALSNLKSAQDQLVQSEKMASLGELTAGIAHEIQNPLNFVNNFSDLNKELLEELKIEIGNGNIEEIQTIADDIITNEIKINHHGKRADAIVKGMLQHSGRGSGVKEPTDINALCDEYLRLSYHGLRAKDKSFNATLLTDFDPSVGKINVITQDLGRVVLNLFTNAFYAVNEKKITNPEDYYPTVSITTKKINNTVEIQVKDNGDGIPHNAIDKIFQPFFTTKPTGKGTGLGLSMSYDIVTKGHGGELKVETKENEYTSFTIILNY